MRVNKVFEGLTVIAIGFLLLGNTLGYLPWTIWWSIVSLWPLLLVAAGIDIIGKSADAVWLRVLSSLIVLAGLGYGAFVMPTGAPRFGIPVINAGEVRAFSVTAPDSEVSTARFTFSGGVGDVTLRDGREFASASGRTGFGEPDFDLNSTKDPVELELDMGESSGPWAWNPQDQRVEVLLGDDVLWNLELHAGVSDFKADLEDLKVESLRFEGGVSDATITLGDVPAGVDEVLVDVRAGVSSVTVRVPQDEEARIEWDGGLSGLDVDSDFDEVGDGDPGVYETDGYSEGAGVYLLKIKGGVSSVTVERY